MNHKPKHTAAKPSWRSLLTQVCETPLHGARVIDLLPTNLAQQIEATQRRHLTYYVWIHMKHRCHNQKNKYYSDYGGRGITVCEKWRRSFYAFISDMGEQPPNHSLERLNNNLGYCKSNCAWVTGNVQYRNRRNNVFYSHAGETLCLSAWAERVGLNATTLSQRIRKWGMAEAISRPIDHVKQRASFLAAEAQWGARRDS